MNILICPSCGKPPTIRKVGDAIRVHASITYDEDGRIIHSESRSGWCAACLEDWDARARPDKP